MTVFQGYFKQFQRKVKKKKKKKKKDRKKERKEKDYLFSLVKTFFLFFNLWWHINLRDLMPLLSS